MPVSNVFLRLWPVTFLAKEFGKAGVQAVLAAFSVCLWFCFQEPAPSPSQTRSAWSRWHVCDYNDDLVGPKSAPAGYLAKYKFMNISGQEILINNVLRDLIFIKMVTRILRNVQIRFMNKLIKILSF